jgi:hypothetical protein
MSEPTLQQVTVLVENEDAVAFRHALSQSKVLVENAGVQRGAEQAADLIVLAAPTVVILALVLEKLRRLRLPRTYLRATPEGLDVWTDSTTRDGRILVVHPDGRVEELPDSEISVGTLEAVLTASDDS